MEQPFPEPHPSDPDDGDVVELRPDRDPDEARQRLIDDDATRRRARQRAVDLAERSGRICAYGAEYVAGTWPFDLS